MAPARLKTSEIILILLSGLVMVVCAIAASVFLSISAPRVQQSPGPQVPEPPRNAIAQRTLNLANAGANVYKVTEFKQPPKSTVALPQPSPAAIKPSTEPKPTSPAGPTPPPSRPCPPSPFPTLCANNKRTGFVPKGPEPPLELKWRVRLDNPSAVTVGNGLAYVTTSFDVCALSPETGEEVWRHAMPRADEYFKIPPMICGDLLYAAVGNTFVCLDSLGGNEKWHFTAETNVFPSVVAFEDLVIFGTGYPPEGEKSKFIYALDRKTGEVKWKFEYADPKIPAWVLSPMMDETDARIYCGARVGNDNFLFALDARTGRKIWETVAPKVPRLSIINGAVTSVYKATYVPVRNPGSSGLCLSSNRIVSCLEGLQLYEKFTGKWVWSFLPSGYLRKPALANGTIVFATEGIVYADMMVLAISESSLRELWRYRTPAPFTDYTLSSDRVYLTSGWLDVKDPDSLLAVLSLQKGSEIWTSTIEDAVGLFPPTVTPDSVYVSGLNAVHKFGM